jgi:predicted DNA-binding transcriptional regulator AlpA
MKTQKFTAVRRRAVLLGDPFQLVTKLDEGASAASIASTAYDGFEIEQARAADAADERVLNATDAAVFLGVSRTTIYMWLKTDDSFPKP